MTIEKQNTENVTTQIGLHSISNILGKKNQKEMFESHHKKFCKEYGIARPGSNHAETEYDNYLLDKFI